MTTAAGASRRGLFRKLMTAESLRGPDVVDVRPPGALSELQFLDRCTRCNECLQACPEQVIVRGDGGFPALDVRARGCSGCGDCKQACPTGALQADGARWPDATVVIQASCLARNQITCQSCKDACDQEAIRFPLTASIPQPDVLSDRCTGCGECVAVCPTNSIQLLARSAGDLHQ